MTGFPFVFSGNEGSLEGLETMRELGIGRLVSAQGARRGRDGTQRMGSTWKAPVPGVPWILDNGAFSAWRTGIPWEPRLFERALRKIPPAHRPLFAVIPDVVAGGLHSLVFSLSWLPRLPHGWPWYLAVQDGMTVQDVEPHVRDVGGLFVGGTLAWKHATAEDWIRLGHENGLRVHIGRVGQLQDLVWARRIGADSVDSSTWARNDSYHIVESARSQTNLEVAP